MVPSQLPKQDALGANTSSATGQVVQHGERRQDAAAANASASTSTTHPTNRAAVPAGHDSNTTAHLGSRAQGVQVAAQAGQQVQLTEASHQEAAGETSIKPAQLMNRGQQPTIAAPEMAVTATADACMHGFLEHVPASWLRLLVRSLPGACQRSLFASTKWLATVVLEAAPWFVLRLLARQDCTAEQIEMRRNIITHLLRARRKFHVELLPGPWQPFPTELAGRVMVLRAHDMDLPGSLPVSSCCQWSNLTGLDGVGLSTAVDIAEVCAAAEAGQLRQLTSLILTPAIHAQPNGNEAGDPEANGGEADGDPVDDGEAVEGQADDQQVAAQPDLDRLVRTLGPQLTFVSSSVESLVQHVPKLTRLQMLILDSCTVTDHMMQQLCEHATLKHLTLRTCVVQGDHCHRQCRWESLAVSHVSLHQLAKLPLANVHRVQLLYGCKYEPAGSLQEIEACLAQHSHKIACTSAYALVYRSAESPYFILTNPCAAMLPLFKCMKGVTSLTLKHGKYLGTPQQFWQTLPPSIHTISFCNINGIQWAGVWQGLPQHVVCVDIIACEITAEELRSLVCSTPAHIRTLKLAPCPELRAVWQVLTKLLHAEAPEHLQLDVSM